MIKAEKPPSENEGESPSHLSALLWGHKLLLSCEEWGYRQDEKLIK